MITMNDIIRDLENEKEENAYYWDALNDTGYHVHVLPNGKLVCMKAKDMQIRVISEKEFIDAVNDKCYGNAISENSYYDTVKNVSTMTEVLNIVEGAEINKRFSYEVDAHRWFFVVETSQAPSAEVMKKLYDMDMRVTYELYASAEKGRYMKYVINHRDEIDYEWTNGAPL